MAMFEVSIRDAGGRRRTVVREAASAREAADGLRAERMLVLSVRERKPSSSLPGRWNPAWLLPMTGFDAETGLRQLAAMLRSGVTLVEALGVAEEQARRPRASLAWRRVKEAVLGGTSFADALGAHRRRFGLLSVHLAQVGERSGELELALSRAADHLETRRRLGASLANALVYPFLAVAATVGVSAFLVTAVIPKVAAFLQAGGGTLPPITRALVDFSEWTLANGPWLIAAVAAAVAGWFALRATRAGHEAEDALLLRIPVSGAILRLAGTALFARSMETMSESGVSLVDALETASELLANRRLRRRVADARAEVIRGASLSDALAVAREFMPMLRSMAAVGEKTGTLAEAFGQTASFHELMLETAIRRFGVLIEPVMIAITGTIVGFVYIAFFTAVFSMANAG